MSVNSKGWMSKVVQGLLVVLGVAVVARIAWELLWPLVPALLVLICLLALFGLLLDRSRR